VNIKLFNEDTESKTNRQVRSKSKQAEPRRSKTPLTKTAKSTKTTKTRDKLSKSLCQPNNYRKLLFINSPDEEEAKNNEKKVIETLSKAIANNTVNNLPTKHTEYTKLASVNLNDSNKTKLRNVIKSLPGGYKYTGESIKDIDEANYLIAKLNIDINKEPKVLYAYLFRKIKIVSYLYFLDIEKKSVNIEDYFINVAVDLDQIVKLKSCSIFF
jgi:vacuolar-type H+-ATPase subunit I/STV1